jgi:VanZ family protein
MERPATSQEPYGKTLRRVVQERAAAICLGILLGILFAGLRPFNPFPPNGVSWLGNEDGLRFANDSAVLSAGSFAAGRAAEGCSLEVWIRSTSNRGESTILNFYDAKTLRQTRLLQSGNSYLLLTESDRFHKDEIGTKHAFEPLERVLITATSGSQGMALYLNGVVAKMLEHSALARSDCSGRLILGTAAENWVTWNGDVLGIAVYRQQLDASQVARHYNAWSTKGRPEAETKESEIALYRFTERSGTVVHSEIAGSPDLYIPADFQVPYKLFLALPWTEFNSNWAYVKDLSTNIAGFIPFGFFFFVFLLSTRHRNHAALATILLGALVSLTIEVAQWHLPRRSSSMTDLLTNVLGTGIGIIPSVLLFHHEPTVA